jgi:DNA mismatch repair protein MSH6
MKQYWDIKRENFDKILFFKIGKFYEIFYDDAILCHRLLDLSWMQGKKLHTGFYESALDKFVSMLVSQGYKVAVIE